MAKYYAADPNADYGSEIARLCRHHDHLKLLLREYAHMQQTTLQRMVDAQFRFNEKAQQLIDENYYTAVLLKLSPDQAAPLFAPVRVAYEQLRELVLTYYPQAHVEIYFDSAHITIKALLAGVQQSEQALAVYLPHVQSVLQRWLVPNSPLAEQTLLYGMGLFCDLHAAKGLSVGIRFFPTQPLLQILRGNLGDMLYHVQPPLPLRPETQFHTMLTHATGMRIRNLSTPFSRAFSDAFFHQIQAYEHTVFGVIDGITTDDFVIRNGYTDKMLLGCELRCSADFSVQSC